jgi:hypothetical protein
VGGHYPLGQSYRYGERGTQPAGCWPKNGITADRRRLCQHLAAPLKDALFFFDPSNRFVQIPRDLSMSFRN